MDKEQHRAAKARFESQCPTKKFCTIVLRARKVRKRANFRDGIDLRTLYIIASVMNLPPGSTFIMEETENGLHPNRLTNLLDHLEMLSVKRDIQVIYSTHSPIVINKLNAEEVIFVEKDTAHGTRLHVLSDTQHQTNIRKLLEDGIPLAEYMYTRMLPAN